jgi:hypothetical protein
VDFVTRGVITDETIFTAVLSVVMPMIEVLVEIQSSHGFKGMSAVSAGRNRYSCHGCQRTVRWFSILTNGSFPRVFVMRCALVDDCLKQGCGERMLAQFEISNHTVRS